MSSRPEARPLGLFGGTFDPVHLGHLRLAEEGAESLGLAQVRWIPAGQPPPPGAPPVAPAPRPARGPLGLGGNTPVSLDDAEVAAREPSYTVHTLERLRTQEGAERPLVLLLGADAFAGLASWHRWQDVLGLAHVAVAHRPGFAVAAANLPPALAPEVQARRCSPEALAASPAGRIATFAMTQLAISATQVRNLLLNGRSPRYLLPAQVIAYIEAHGLYRNT